MLRAANKNLYDCRWQSYRYYAVATSVATDEVEAIDYHHRLVRRCYLRPHPSRAKARDTFPSRGRLSLRRVLRIEFERAGHAAAPTFVNDTTYRPSSGPFGTTFPSRGRLFSVPSVPYVDFIRSNVPGWRIGACRRPYRASPFLHPAPQGISALPFSLFSFLLKNTRKPPGACGHRGVPYRKGLERREVEKRIYGVKAVGSRLPPTF